MSPGAEPRLPRELERVIFELAALSRPVLIPDLVLVASRVKEWIQPLLYHTLVFDSADFTTPVDGLRSYNAASFSRIIQHQRNLAECARNLIFIGSEQGEFDNILLACPHVQNLFVMWPSEDEKPNRAMLDALPLRHLYCEIRYLAPTNPFSRPFLSTISHLELFSTPDETDWVGLVRLPRLTHLALDQYDHALCNLVLNECSSLRLLVVLTPPGPHTDYSTVGADLRFVMMTLSNYMNDWQRGALHGHDYWARAEDFMAKRRAGHPAPDPDHPFHLVC
ncbi:hypothetical protein FB45DRAFT_1051096 [Roridomyces roridus]|uniref:Uncharacterized protein n=1 Tax=Roridomyces roridus TaxID=1738132 RepID=A0AAD7CKZ0_9AGAR|nr:hypothetical protein FB45DRAFT_1051096 [Roridomyces roridus]